MNSNKEPFECTQCGECCKGYGGTFLGGEDIRAIADFLGISQEEIRQRYCSFSGGRPILTQGPDGYCIFFNQNCSIHPVKPRMCRNWPFIQSLLVDIRNWYVMADSCPGMRRDLDDQNLLEAVKTKIEAFGDARKHTRNLLERS